MTEAEIAALVDTSRDSEDAVLNTLVAVAAQEEAELASQQESPSDGTGEALVAQMVTRKVENIDFKSKYGRARLVLDGVCSHCAHCGQKLTDAVSIERGIGPVCSKKGYLEEPSGEPDEMMAMVYLSAWPTLVQYLNDNYKPKGVRGLMNGLVKISSLNRGTDIHDACTHAIDALGFARLAATLRESLAIIEITESKTHPDNYEVWVKKAEFKWDWIRQLRTTAKGTFFDRHLRMQIVPVSSKRALWDSLLAHYVGFCATVRAKDGTKKTIKVAKAQ